MARKKSFPGKPAPAQEFSHSPFRNLKGLSAFDVPQTQPMTDKVAKSATKEPEVPTDDLNAFADEMALLGVKSLPERDAEAMGPVKGTPQQPLQSPEVSGEERDRAVFLEALGAMSTTFVDESPEAETGRQAAPRRIRQVARGQLKPEAELDLHGLNAAEAVAKVRFFLQDTRFRGLETLLIITGKGLHSGDGPVLRQAVEKLLAQMHELVLEWGVAPRRYGGDGAVVVFLRRPANE
jgi:DNA-nicking Smr family endonuclease